jgi:hypothetical protein
VRVPDVPRRSRSRLVAAHQGRRAFSHWPHARCVSGRLEYADVWETASNSGS